MTKPLKEKGNGLCCNTESSPNKIQFKKDNNSVSNSDSRVNLNLPAECCKHFDGCSAICPLDAEIMECGLKSMSKNYRLSCQILSWECQKRGCEMSKNYRLTMFLIM